MALSDNGFARSDGVVGSIVESLFESLFESMFELMVELIFGGMGGVGAINRVGSSGRGGSLPFPKSCPIISARVSSTFEAGRAGRVSERFMAVEFG